MADHSELVERLWGGQVCSIAQNSCRNRVAMEQAAAAIQSLQAENARLEARVKELEGRIETLGLTCEANEDGEHVGMQQGKNYWFCRDCGLSLRRVLFTLPHAKPSEVRQALEDANK